MASDVSGEDIFKNVTETPKVIANHHSRVRLKGLSPYQDFHHFKESYKPWIGKGAKIDHGPHEFWYATLRTVNDELNFGIDVDNVQTVGFSKPNLGLFPTYNDVQRMKEIREKNDPK